MESKLYLAVLKDGQIKIKEVKGYDTEEMAKEALRRDMEKALEGDVDNFEDMTEEDSLIDELVREEI